MALKQGFKSSDGNVYVYQENTDTNNISSAMGIDAAGLGQWFVSVVAGPGAGPGVGFTPITVDVINGDITLTPQLGQVIIDGPLDVTGGISFSGDLVLEDEAVSTVARSVIFQKDRAGAVIVTGDDLGQIFFKGFDGTAYVTGASIRSDSSGTIGANRVAGNLVFATHPDSASGLTAVDRMTISPAGLVTVAGLNTRGVVQTNASGDLATSAGTNGQILISDTATGTPTWATITAGVGISVTNGANSITIATSGGTTWNEVVAGSASMAVDNGYIANNAGLVTLTLPAVATIGDGIEVTGKGAGGWQIAQNAGQTIFFGNATTTPGAGGSLASTHAKDSIRLVCVTANNDWNVLSSIGIITVV